MKINYKLKAMTIINNMNLTDSASSFRMLYNIAILNPNAIVRAHNLNVSVSQRKGDYDSIPVEIQTTDDIAF